MSVWLLWFCNSPIRERLNMSDKQEVSYTTIFFDSLAKEDWLRKISFERGRYDKGLFKNQIVLEFSPTLKAEDFEPIHLVTLACLIHFLDENEHRIYIASANDSVRNMLFNDLRFQDYWSGEGVNHVDSDNNNIFNLWRIVENEKDLYAKGVEKYFKCLFKNKDLSVISLSLIEAYYNVFDHAEANGNAFSLIKYEEDKNKLHVAICDFGKGIAKSVRDFTPSIPSDKDALEKSIETDFTVRSKMHNKGKGMDNILSCSNVIRIFCNNALLLKSDENIKLYDIDFHFYGTLIYLEIDLSAAEDEEILEEFEL